ncbi:MAG: hypothetical protein LW768_22115 [Rubrivivax sp.]|nr:hypothetical protein [Rubrivivax sp.]
MTFCTPEEAVRRKAAEVKARVEEKRATLKRLAGRLPASHQIWTAQQARDFKTAASTGMTAANNPRATEALLDSAIRRLEQFYY